MHPTAAGIAREMMDTAELRIPMQQRGTRRVEAVLDAAAALVVESGAEGVTVQALALRAQTSKGSLYHFFPDVPSVLRALADRHLRQISLQLADIMHDTAIPWRDLDAHSVVVRMMTPVAYLATHPDLLALIRAPGVLTRSARSMQPIHEFVNFILTARYPAMDAERCSTRAATIVAVIDGVVGMGACGCMRGAEGMRRELEEMLVFYVDGLR